MISKRLIKMLHQSNTVAETEKALEDYFLVLARTTMRNNRVCIGGCLLSNNRYVRILSLEEQNVNSSEPYEIGEIYNIKYYNRKNIIPPHTEDILVISRTCIRKMIKIEFLSKIKELNLNLKCIRNLFDGCLNWSERQGFLTKRNVPKTSVLITSLDYDLFKFENNKKFSVNLNGKWYYIPYVGEGELEPKVVIPRGTPIRFSLARWWIAHGHKDSQNNPEERSYLQISTYYNLK